MKLRCGDSPSTDNSSTDFSSTPTTRRQANSRHLVDLILSTAKIIDPTHRPTHRPQNKLGEGGKVLASYPDLT
jgi:hypothetical protein